MSQRSMKWVFFLETAFTYNIRSHLPEDFPTGYVFFDKSGERRLEIRPNGDITILPVYAWDGCTPKFCLWDIVFGIPDGIPNQDTRRPKAYYASLVHDVLYQFLDDGLPLSRAAADRILLELLTRDCFAPKYVYYFAVRLFGWIFRPLTKWKRSYRGRREIL